jgi:DNA repair exonuclease SbcCD ATPase subunit
LCVKKTKYAHPDRLNKPLEFQDTIELHGGFKKWRLKVLENYSDCKSKEDANDKVEEWYKTLRPPPCSSELPLMNRICKKCGKIFTRSDNLLRHIKINCNNKPIESCVKENDKIDELEERNKALEEINKQDAKTIKELEKTIKEAEKKIKEDAKKIKELEKKNKDTEKKNKELAKIDEEIKKINQKLNNNVNEKINKKIPNNINLIELGHEKLSDIFTINQQKNILSKKYKSLEYLISGIHFNSKYPQFHNICITNIHDRVAYKYVEADKCFIAITKEQLYREIKTARLNDIIDFMNNCSDILDENTKRILDEFIDKMTNDDEYAENYCKDIKNIIYNGSKQNNIGSIMKDIMNVTQQEPPNHQSNNPEPNNPEPNNPEPNNPEQQ